MVAAIVTMARRAQPAPTTVATYEAARGHALRTTVLAWVAAVAVGLVLIPLAPALVTRTRPIPGLIPALVPTTVGLVLVGVHAVGEVTWPRPTGAVRSATLTPRTVADIAPRLLRRAL